MRTALVTTTINIPHVLCLYRRADPDVRFFIAADQKTPLDTNLLAGEIKNAWCIFPEMQTEWKCSDLIGWNCIQRRNIATLEALKWGAELIVFVDDDNIPLNVGYFEDFRQAVNRHDFVGNTKFNGLLASPETDWFDIGQFLDPVSPHRGFPYPQLGLRQPRLSHVVDAKIGAAAGIVLGDPDISAQWRVTHRPHVLHASPLLNAGIAVDPRHTRTVFNTQNSAVLRQFAPAMLLCPQFKRYDDIIASLVCQRVMADTGHHVLFGPPFVYQERNAHDLSKDLADEQWGQANILAVQIALWRVVLTSGMTITNKVVLLYEALDKLMPGVTELAHAWVEDCERAMS